MFKLIFSSVKQVLKSNCKLSIGSCLICMADGIVEEAWFDSVGLFDSDCDDDYQSVPDGMIWRILIFDVLVKSL